MGSRVQDSALLSEFVSWVEAARIGLMGFRVGTLEGSMRPRMA